MNLVKLKKEKIDIDYKIKKIENIIENSENLEEYILLIENSKQDTPVKLTNKILNRINEIKLSKEIKYETDSTENIKNNTNNKSSEKVIKRLEHKFIDIIKIAACTVFALLIWEMTPTNITYAQDNVKSVEIEKIDEDKTNSINKIEINRKVSNFFMSPISIERGEK